MRRIPIAADEERAKSIRDWWDNFDENMPTEGWAWEFIRRNPGYKTLYESIKDDFEVLIKGAKSAQAVIDKFEHSPIIKKFLQVKSSYSVLCEVYEGKPKDAENFICFDALDLFIEVPNPDMGYNKFSINTPRIDGATSVRVFKSETLTANKFNHFTSQQDTQEYYEYCLKLITGVLPPTQSIDDTIYIGVYKNAPIGEVMKRIDNFLTPILKPDVNEKQGRNRYKNWKRYLAVYDIKQPHQSNADIADILKEAFEENEEPHKLFSTERNISEYNRKALELLQGKYKIDLHLT